MISSQLIEGEPHKLFINKRFCILRQRQSDLSRAHLPITLSPNKRGRLIEAVRTISLEIVNQSLVRQILDDQTFLARARFCLFGGLHKFRKRPLRSKSAEIITTRLVSQ